MQYYRNKTDITSIEGIHVDRGALWVLENDILVLEDEDQYVTHLLTDDFYLQH